METPSADRFRTRVSTPAASTIQFAETIRDEVPDAGTEPCCRRKRSLFGIVRRRRRCFDRRLIPSLVSFRKFVARAAAALWTTDEDSPFHQQHDVAQCRVLRALRQRRLLRVVSLPSKPSSSRLITSRWRSFRGTSRRLLPEPRLGQDRAERCLRAIDRTSEATQEPLHPRRDVQRRSLCLLEDVVVVACALAGSAPTCCRTVAELPSELARAMSAIARAMRPLPSSNGWIVTNQRCASAALSTASMSRAIEPLKERRISSFERSRRGASKCTRSRADRPRHDLHRRGAVVPPRADADSLHAAPARREIAPRARQTGASTSAAGRSCWVASSIISTTPST